jgi:hypothetical protein
MLCWAGRLQRRRRSMYAYVRRRARRPNEQSRATTEERSRERPSRPLLAQKLARRSLARHQPRSLNEVTAHHARLHCSFLQHMEASEALRWAARAQKDRVWRDFPVFGRDSPREERSALASPSSSPSRTRPPLHPLSAHDGAQGPIDGGCTHSSGPGPAPYSARILFPRRHHPHLALLDGTAIGIPGIESDDADCILFPRLTRLLIYATIKGNAVALSRLSPLSKSRCTMAGNSSIIESSSVG